MKTVEERFLSKVRKTSSCWLWEGCHNANGYGRFWINGRMEQAHRASWMLVHHTIPTQEVMHQCNQKRCVNPDHLMVGSHSENMSQWASEVGSGFFQRLAKRGVAINRLNGFAHYARGEHHGRAKLTWKKVREIRRVAVDGNQRMLARRDRVGAATINDIVTGRHWKEARWQAEAQEERPDG